jgi:uncharacterized damage-inducible protein DinB
MNSETILVLFDYNYWANARILDAAAGLTAEQYTSTVPGLGHGGVRGTLVHMLAAECLWRQRCLEGVSPTTLLQEADFPTLEALRQRWAEEERLMRAGLTRLTERTLAEHIVYRTTAGRPMVDTLWQLLVHLVNHGTQHRAEVAMALTALGHSPGDLDLIIYLRERT